MWTHLHGWFVRVIRCPRLFLARTARFGAALASDRGGGGVSGRLLGWNTHQCGDSGDVIVQTHVYTRDIHFNATVSSLPRGLMVHAWRAWARARRLCQIHLSVNLCLDITSGMCESLSESLSSPNSCSCRRNIRGKRFYSGGVVACYYNLGVRNGVGIITDPGNYTQGNNRPLEGPVWRRFSLPSGAHSSVAWLSLDACTCVPSS